MGPPPGLFSGHDRALPSWSYPNHSVRFVPQAARGLGPPELPLFDFDLPVLLAQTLERLPETPTKCVQVWVRRQPILACVETKARPVAIHLQSLLNHYQTPESVVGFILLHELLHLVIPPREVSGSETSHPPEFWATERRLAPERDLAWYWLWLEFGPILKRDSKAECIRVASAWKKQMNKKRVPMVEIHRMLEADRAFLRSDRGSRLYGSPD